MKITIDINDFTTFITGFNNAYLLYHNDLYAKELCCQSSEILSTVSCEKQRERLKELKYVYEQLIAIEQEDI